LATVNDDYVGISKSLEFAPGITMQNLRVTILDDLGNPNLEGPETFNLALSMPMGAILGDPNIVRVVINDSQSDCKKMMLKLSEILIIVDLIFFTGSICHCGSGLD